LKEKGTFRSSESSINQGKLGSFAPIPVIEGTKVAEGQKNAKTVL